jgi:2-keto-4-pentenoate hydratase
MAVETVVAAEKDRMYQAAELLLAARRELAPIDHLPVELRPHSVEEAYALQDIVALALAPVGGWKVGAPSPDATPMFAPMPLWGGYLRSGERLGKRYSRLRGVEAEVAFLLGADLPVRPEPYSREEIVAAIASAHPAIEILESAFVDPDATEKFSMMGDLQINGGFAYGPAVADWQAIDLPAETVKLVIDGAVRCEAGMANPGGTDVLRLVTWLANEGQYRTGGLKAGDWITTGSWTGKLYAVAGSSVEVSFAHFGGVAISFE